MATETTILGGDALLTHQEIADLLRVHHATLRRWRAAGKFPGPDVGVGQAPLWRRSTLERWITSGAAKG